VGTCLQTEAVLHRPCAPAGDKSTQVTAEELETSVSEDDREAEYLALRQSIARYQRNMSGFMLALGILPRTRRIG
jgi:hypothetical protein